MSIYIGEDVYTLAGFFLKKASTLTSPVCCTNDTPAIPILLGCPPSHCTLLQFKCATMHFSLLPISLVKTYGSFYFSSFSCFLLLLVTEGPCTFCLAIQYTDPPRFRCFYAPISRPSWYKPFMISSTAAGIIASRI